MRRLILALAVVLAAVPGTATAADTAGSVGVIGCSNTLQATQAYLDASDADVLALTARWGTSLEQWASSRNQRFWEQYDALRPAAGYDAVWLNLCARVSKRTGEPTMNQGHIDAVLAKIWERDPGALVYVNPLNTFTDEACPTSGGNAVPVLGDGLADATAATYPLVERIPNLGPIEGNPCHLTETDKTLIGAQLVAVFG